MVGQTALSESLRGVEAEIAAGQPERALARCQEVQARYPRALSVQRVLGEVYLALRKPREALAALDRALAGNPEDARACCARALVHQIHGDSLAALAWYRRACDTAPDDQVLRSAYRELALHLNQPAYQPTRMGLARLYLRGDLFPNAIREWGALLVEQPDSLEAQVGLAETLWRARRAQEASECCQRILTNAPSCVKPLLILAAIEFDAGHADETQRLLRRVAELDPDQRLARSLFADRFAAGDTAFTRMVLGDEGAAAQPFMRHTGALSGVLDPRVAGAMNGSTSQPITQSRTPTAQPSPSASLTTDTAAETAVRPSTLPADFRTIFAETEYMLWSREDEATQSPTGAMPAFARSTTFVPPALRDQGADLEDTEARAAINWIQWLQAQGARAREGAASRGATGPLVPPATGPLPGPRSTASTPAVQPAPSATGRLPQGLPPVQPEAEWPPQATGPLPPPSSEALRAMFAELGPDATNRRVVEGELVSAVDADPSPLNPAEVATARLDEHDAAVPTWSDSQAAVGWTPEGAPPPGDATPSGEPAPDESAEPSEPSESAESPVLTLESLERSFADSGFAHIDLQPGELAALSEQGVEGNGWHEVTASLLSEEALTASRPSLPSLSTATDVAAEPEPAEDNAVPAEPKPDPDDYPARLDLARKRRGDGQLDEALNEYRHVLKNAPDLLDTVVSELQESLSAAPDHPEIHRLLGDARIRQGDYLSALEAYNRAVALTQAQGS